MLDTLLLLARIALVAVFGVAGIAKLLDRPGSQDSLLQFGVPAVAAPLAAVLLPLLELACALALLNASWASWGAIGALALLSLFTLAIAVNMMLGRRPDCHCFGQLHSTPVGWPTLARNLLLTGLAGALVWQAPHYVSVESVWSGMSETGAALLILALLFIAQTAIGVFALYQLLRQNGRMLQRLDAIEAKLGGTGDKFEDAPLVVGSDAPAFSLEDLEGAAVSLESLGSSGKPVVLLFTEPGCNSCEAILPDVGTWQRDHADRLVIMPISRGAVEVNRTKATKHQINTMLLQHDREVAQMYRVYGTPSALMVKDGRIVSPVLAGPDLIRQMVRRWTMPPPLKQGERVPSLELQDLNGRNIDLASVMSRRTVLLFWNPACGFCSKILDDVKAWEGERPKDAPELVVISAGTPQVNRAQGFRSRVLIDGQFTAGGRFGAGGTPAAVLIDADGTIASEVKTGTDRVMELMEGRLTEAVVG